MDRALGLAGAARDLPVWLEPILAVVTQAGDGWFLLVVLASLTVLTRRRGRAVLGLGTRPVVVLAGLTLVAFGLTETLKAVFALPRPAGAGVAAAGPWVPAGLLPAYEWLATATGHGFPSGHALTGTVFYGGFAVLSDRWRMRTRAVGAAAVVATVAASRVLLGVHFLVDVVVGVALGLGVLVVFSRLSRWLTPTILFGLAALLGFGGVLAFGAVGDLAVTGGLGLGGLTILRLTDLAGQ